MRRVRLSEIRPLSGQDKCETYELIGKGAAVQRREYSVAKTVVPPHTKAVEHYHDHTEELYVVTGGSGAIVVDGKSIDVSVGDTVLIEIGERHFAMSNSDCGLELLAISFPAYDSGDFYESLNAWVVDNGDESKRFESDS